MGAQVYIVSRAKIVVKGHKTGESDEVLSTDYFCFKGNLFHCNCIKSNLKIKNVFNSWLTKILEYLAISFCRYLSRTILPAQRPLSLSHPAHPPSLFIPELHS